jgi:hypothetical protein
MKTAKIIASLMLLGALAGCESRPATTSDVDSLRAAAGADRADAIAGDKTAMADMIRRSYAKGTFDDALALAMQDSALAQEIFQAVRADARFNAPNTATAASASTAGKKTAVTRTTSGTKSTARSGDILDKSEETMRKANEKIDQAARVKQQAEEARRKVEGIFHP